MQSFSRRALMRRGAVAGAALATGAGAFELLTGAPAGAATRRLDRGVVLGPDFASNPTQRYESNRDRFAETGTRWVRLWADWAVLQPEQGVAPDAGGGARAVAALDAQVDRARADGRSVMLTAYRFARWANGTAALDESADARFEPADRLRRGGDPARRKPLEFRLPADLSPAGAWAGWIGWLLDRYGGRVDALELVNEPNLQLWPQRDAAGRLTIDAATADMVETTSALAARRPHAPLLVAPATADSTGASRLHTGFELFTPALLGRLAERRFDPGPGFAWSHHGYNDVERDLAGGANRVALTRALLAGRWAGWPKGDAAEPGLLVTETGARPATVARRFGAADWPGALRLQADLLGRNAWRMAAGPEGAGVAALFQYLFVTDLFFDSGLCELDGTPRPAYFAWAGAARAA